MLTENEAIIRTNLNRYLFSDPMIINLSLVLVYKLLLLLVYKLLLVLVYKLLLVLVYKLVHEHYTYIDDSINREITRTL